MAQPAVNMPDWMVEEILERREKGSNRSAYIREALQARFDAEDAGEWEEIEDPMARRVDH